jgi:HEAT repeat protein
VKRFIFLAGLAGALLGCGKAEPVLSGGKPVGYWVEALQSPEPRLRKEAAFKLGNAGLVEPTVFPAVVATLKDTDPQVRAEAVKALVKYGRAAREALPVLEEMRQRDTDPSVRTVAARALDALRP